MRLEDILNICDAYADLGDSIQDQLKDLALDQFVDAEDFNPNALDVIRRDFLAVVERIANDPHRQDYELQHGIETLRERMQSVYAEMDED